MIANSAASAAIPMIVRLPDKANSTASVMTVV